MKCLDYNKDKKTKKGNLFMGRYDIGKARNIDFVLRESKYSRYIFRFYPRASHCHGFGDEPPKDWKGVYKVYYSYAIIRQSIEDGVVTKARVVWESECDECSVIDEVAYICDKVAKNIFHEVVTLKNGDRKVFNYVKTRNMPMGDGVIWYLNRETWYEHFDENNDFLDKPIKMYDYRFTMTRGYDGVSYVFTLPIGKVEAFGQYLQKCCDYMLEHGEPI